MDKRKHSAASYMIWSAISRPVYGKSGSCPIDKVTAKSFNVDAATGRPMSDIDYIVKSREATAEMALFMSLDDIKSNYLPADIAPEDALKFSVPRYAQTPAELADLAVKFEKFKLDKAEADRKAKELEEYRKSFEENTVDSKTVES